MVLRIEKVRIGDTFCSVAMKISKQFPAMKEIKCDSHIIKEVKQFEYLGSKFDSEGRYQKEIIQEFRQVMIIC